LQQEATSNPNDQIYRQCGPEANGYESIYRVLSDFGDKYGEILETNKEYVEESIPGMSRLMELHRSGDTLLCKEQLGSMEIQTVH
jgi:hypothetical protein